MQADILVVGGGIGGLTAALALARDGHRVRVLEKAAQFAELGAGLQLAPNATRVLAANGVEGVVRPVFQRAAQRHPGAGRPGRARPGARCGRPAAPAAAA